MSITIIVALLYIAVMVTWISFNVYMGLDRIERAIRNHLKARD